jgi:hypothetical protein
MVFKLNQHAVEVCEIESWVLSKGCALGLAIRRNESATLACGVMLTEATKTLYETHTHTQMFCFLKKVK